jgi:hypothetical protein
MAAGAAWLREVGSFAYHKRALCVRSTAEDKAR